VSANSAFLGRLVQLLPNDTSDDSIFGLRSKSIQFLGEALDSTSDDDDSWQRFHPEVPRRGLSIAASGIAKGGLIKRVAQEGHALNLIDWSLHVPTVGVWTGDWIASGFAIDAETDTLATFNGTINSNGPLVFDPEGSES
jgi:predicted secreted protein